MTNVCQMGEVEDEPAIYPKATTAPTFADAANPTSEAPAASEATPVTGAAADIETSAKDAEEGMTPSSAADVTDAVGSAFEFDQSPCGKGRLD